MRTFSRPTRRTNVMGRAPARPAVVLMALWFGAALQSLSSGCATRPSATSALTPPRTAAVEAGDPAIVCDPGSHDVLLSWLAGDSTGYRIWFARSADQGATWSTPAAVTPEGEPLRLQPESSPRMVCTEGGRIGIAWSTSVELAGGRSPASDLRFASSADGGRSWTRPVPINDDTASGPGSHMFHALAIGPKDVLYAAWLDSRPGGDSLVSDEAEGHAASIHLARSDDFGARWGRNVAQWSRVCPCCRASLVIDPTGTAYTAFRKRFSGQIRDVVLARPGYAPIRTHEDSWETADCPRSGPPLVRSHDGTLRMAWFTGAKGRAGVYFRQDLPDGMDSTHTPVAVLTSEKPSAVHVDLGEAGMSGTLVAMDADSTGASQLTLARVESSGRRVAERFVVPGTLGASHPKVATTLAGRHAYVVWTTRVGDHSELRMLRWDAGR